METDVLIVNILNWADNKGLLKPENSAQQLCKTMEELGETAGALLRNDKTKLADGIGDVAVTLIILAAQNGLSFEACLELAWNEIKDRKGRTVAGTFIKEGD